MTTTSIIRRVPLLAAVAGASLMLAASLPAAAAGKGSARVAGATVKAGSAPIVRDHRKNPTPCYRTYGFHCPWKRPF